MLVAALLRGGLRGGLRGFRDLGLCAASAAAIRRDGWSRPMSGLHAAVRSAASSLDRRRHAEWSGAAGASSLRFERTLSSDGASYWRNAGVEELKAMCESKGISSQGNRADLIQRLREEASMDMSTSWGSIGTDDAEAESEGEGTDFDVDFEQPSTKRWKDTELFEIQAMLESQKLSTEGEHGDLIRRLQHAMDEDLRISGDASTLEDKQRALEREAEEEGQVDTSSEFHKNYMGRHLGLDPKAYYYRVSTTHDIIKVLQRAHAFDICVIDMHEHKNRAYESIVICSGNSSQHIHVLGGAVLYHLMQRCSEVMPGVRPKMDASPGCHWVALDCGSILVHIFIPPARYVLPFHPSLHSIPPPCGLRPPPLATLGLWSLTRQLL